MEELRTSALFAGFTAAPLQAFATCVVDEYPGRVPFATGDTVRPPGAKAAGAPERLTAPGVNAPPEGRGTLLENETPDRAVGAETAPVLVPTAPALPREPVAVDTLAPAAPVVLTPVVPPTVPAPPGPNARTFPVETSNENAIAKGVAKGESCPKIFMEFLNIHRFASP